MKINMRHINTREPECNQLNVTQLRKSFNTQKKSDNSAMQDKQDLSDNISNTFLSELEKFISQSKKRKKETIDRMLNAF